MPKMEIVELKDMEVVEDNGEFKTVYKNEKKYPASITNYSLSLGESLGLLTSSQMTDLEGVQRVFEAALNPEKHREKAMEGLDINQYMKVIYLAVMGVNPNLQLSFDEFTSRYHATIPETLETYTNLVLGTLGVDENEFAKGLMQSTKKRLETNKK
ncbi:hypothetical protein [Evansella clarkii]|uniref:hypothetical protein n=1 Tax=Evansella clarkii TaxID=79879 RepID=UPI000B43D0C4|nr:hypothetical protein [Evansella clarkii]